jgi:hypothetical protein
MVVSVRFFGGTGDSGGRLVEECIERSDAVAADDDHIEASYALRVFGGSKTPGQAAGIRQRFGRADFPEYVTGHELMQGRNGPIECSTVLMMLVRIGEDRIFDKELSDRGTTLCGVVLAKYFQQITLQKPLDGG